MIAISTTVKWQETRVIAEPEGQFLIIQGLIAGSEWTLVGVYAPQIGKGNFFSLLIKKIHQYGRGNIAMMGDFNVVMDPGIDKSKQGSSQSVLPEMFRTLLQEKGYVDTWREQ